ncbi:MAG: ribonuclease HIII [Planctomycetia bacterium]
MVQETLVLKLPPSAATDLRRRLQPGAFEWRSVPHAAFSAKGEGVVVTFYESGKLLLQGADPAGFALRWFDLHAAPAVATKPASASRAAAPAGGSSGGAVAIAAPTIGSDECGKGDYFGPLVVAAVRLEPEEARALAGSNVRDSKTLSDEQCLRIGSALRARHQVAVKRLDPPRYNAAHARPGALNGMLADLHAQAIRELARPGDRVVVDQFADERLVATRLAGLDIDLEQRHKAESELAVAAASIVAREEFLVALKELSERHGVELRKGAGAPTDASAREFVRLHGRGPLGEVAKLHFKNTQKIRL